MKILHSVLILVFLVIWNNAFADYPIVGYRFLADPGAIVYNGRVYVYCSNDDENDDDSYDMSSIVCVSSSDLKNWTDHGVVFDVPRDASWSGLSWAPSPAYRNGKFYLYFGNGGSAIGVAVSDSPTGPFKDPVGRAIVTGSTPGVQPFNGWLFDPMTFVDDDGQAYMYFGGNGDGNLRVIKLNNDMISTSGSAGKFTVPNFFEAAWMHKHNGKYYFSYSTTPSAGMRIDYMVSNNPMSGFTYGGVLSPQPPTNNNNNHHANFFLNGQWYQMYHNRIVASQTGVGMAYHRNLAIDAFSHRQDGTIVQMVNTVNGVKQIKYLDPYVRVEAETMSDQKGIETEVCSAGGMNLAYIDNSDWVMVEGVDFGSAGAGRFSASVASNKTGGTIEIRLGSATGTLIGTLQVPNTGAFQTWQTVNTSVNQTTGVHNVYLVFKGSGSSLFNVDHWSFSSAGPSVTITSPKSTDVLFTDTEITITASAQAQNGTIISVEFFYDGKSIGTDNAAPYSINYKPVSSGSHTITATVTDSQGNKRSSEVSITVYVPQGPYKGSPWPIPGIIEAEHYDEGGEGFAYHEANTNGNEGLATLRNDEVDIEQTGDVSGSYNVGYILSGEWLEYTVNVTATDKYDLNLRVAADGTGRTFHVEMDNEDITGAIMVPNTGGWQKWETVTVPGIDLTSGQKIMRIVFESDYMNLNWVEFKNTIVTDLESIQKETTAVYPNPFTDKIYCNINGEYAYQLLNLEGMVLEDGTTLEEIHIRKNYPKGAYILKIKQNDLVKVYKVVKE
ncbi:MAG: carbohydrate-binding protein [Sporocytophaga sp.]|nr:carbohydrate-binding protein [Sporocytophaga sp.]